MTTATPRRGGHRGPGRRVRRMSQQRRRQRWRRRVAGLLGALMVAGLAAAVTVLLTRDGAPGEPPPADATGAPAADPGQDTLLLVTHPQGGGPALSATLLATGPGAARAHVVFVPVGTLVDIPGFGLDRLALAHQYGGAILVEAAVENALGISIDHTAATTRSGLAALFGGTGGLELEIPETLIERARDGTATERFRSGQQFLDGQRLAEYWAFPAEDASELATFPRRQLVLGALLDALSDEGVRATVVGDGAPELDTTAEPEDVRELLAELAAARADGRLSFSLLPVQPFGGPGPEGGSTYRIEDDELAELLRDAFSASVPAGGGSDAVRVEVLNGVGTPGIGQAVDAALDDAGFRIVRTENARSFDFTETRILIYEESPRSLAVARRVRDLLGVGSIQVSRQPQTLVDLTIVVGADFDPAETSS